MRENHVRARIVVVAASACESARILLNSKSSKFPQGLGNSTRQRRQVPDRLDRHRRDGVHPADDGQRAAQRGRRRRRAPLHAVVARQQEARLPARLPHRDRRRPPHARRRLHRRHPQLHRRGRVGHADRRSAATARSSRTTTAASLRRDGELRRPRRDGAQQGHATSSIDPRVVDKWGIPVLRFHFKWSDYERKQVEAHAGDLPRDHPRDGRHAAVGDADAKRTTTASRPAAASSTSSASRAWATIRTRRC